METTALTPMTELEAVNDMLGAIGESPVASLTEASKVADAQLALQLLRKISRWLQAKGWHWNTEEDYRLAPNLDGEITVPPNAVKIDPTDETVDYVYRKGKLWDRTNQTFVIGKAVKVDMVLLYPFDELPEAARQFISQAAQRRFENRIQGDSTAHQINQTDALQAWNDLVQEECDVAGYNVVRDSLTVNRIARRRRP